MRRSSEFKDIPFQQHNFRLPSKPVLQQERHFREAKPAGVYRFEIAVDLPGKPSTYAPAVEQ